MGKINKRLRFVTPFFIRTAAAIMTDIDEADGIDAFRVFCKSGDMETTKHGKKKAATLCMRNGLCFGEPCRDRTDNLLIKSQLLYQLSYRRNLYLHQKEKA